MMAQQHAVNACHNCLVCLETIDAKMCARKQALIQIEIKIEPRLSQMGNDCPGRRAAECWAESPGRASS